MTQYFVKILLSAILIATIAELSKRNSLLAALLASLPLVSLLGMLWLYFDTRDVARISQLSLQIFWLVLPSLVLFLALPALLKYGLSFFLSLALAVFATICSYGLMLVVMEKFGVSL